MQRGVRLAALSLFLVAAIAAICALAVSSPSSSSSLDGGRIALASAAVKIESAGAAPKAAGGGAASAAAADDDQPPPLPPSLQSNIDSIGAEVKEKGKSVPEDVQKDVADAEEAASAGLADLLKEVTSSSSSGSSDGGEDGSESSAADNFGVSEEKANKYKTLSDPTQKEQSDRGLSENSDTSSVDTSAGSWYAKGFKSDRHSLISDALDHLTGRFSRNAGGSWLKLYPKGDTDDDSVQESRSRSPAFGVETSNNDDNDDDISEDDDSAKNAPAYWSQNEYWKGNNNEDN